MPINFNIPLVGANGGSLTGSNIATGQVSVTSSATQIVPVRVGRKSVIIVNPGAGFLYIGKSDVTLSTGVLLEYIYNNTLTLHTEAAVFGICASTQTATFIEIY